MLLPAASLFVTAVSKLRAQSVGVSPRRQAAARGRPYKFRAARSDVAKSHMRPAPLHARGAEVTELHCERHGPRSKKKGRRMSLLHCMKSPGRTVSTWARSGKVWMEMTPHATHRTLTLGVAIVDLDLGVRHDDR